MRPQATAASTALPPSRSTSAPAAAVSGWPAATTPLMAPMLCALAGQRGALRLARVPPPHDVALQRQGRRRYLRGRAGVEDLARARRRETQDLELTRPGRAHD